MRRIGHQASFIGTSWYIPPKNGGKNFFLLYMKLMKPGAPRQVLLCKFQFVRTFDTHAKPFQTHHCIITSWMSLDIFRMFHTWLKPPFSVPKIHDLPRHSTTPTPFRDLAGEVGRVEGRFARFCTISLQDLFAFLEWTDGR